ncbi:DNA polymerase III subunit delta [soil metagenome]
MSITLFTGGDESALRDAVSAHVQELLGDANRSLAVDDYDDPDYELADVIAAANTPPLFTDSRIVVARDIGRFTAEQLRPMIAYLATPNETTSLVLAAAAGRLPKSLTDALAGAGGKTVTTTPPSRLRDRQQWITETARRHGVSLDGDACSLVAAHFGEDVGMIAGLLETLAAAFGPDRRLHVEDVEPFLGERGGIPPWDFTDAIDRGQTPDALGMLDRMVRGGGRHPLQVMAVLHGHYTRLAKLDGAGARNEAQAASAMGIKPGFPARKALELYHKLGGAKIKRAFELLAAADRDLRGARELPDDIVLEVLVARLSRLSV